MSFSLYDAIVPTYRQILEAVSGLITKGESFCTERGIPPRDIIEARLTGDMLPFAYQVKSTAAHSQGAIEALRHGLFTPDRSPLPDTFAALKGQIETARSALEAVKPTELDGFLGRDVRFSFGDRHVDYTAENFLLSFSQPNFYFHATTVYDILRWKGVPIGKRDFMGKPRSK